MHRNSKQPIEAFNAQQLIQEVISIHESEAFRKGLKLRHKLAKPIDSLWIGAPIATRQILIKLLSSAINESTNGSVCLELNASSGDSIEACFSITLRSVGLSKEFHQQLVLTRDMASELGGTVELDDHCINSTELRLSLHFECGALINPKSAPKKQAYHKILQDRSALVADDLEFNRYINSEVLSRMGASVDMAQDGHQTLKQLQKKHYDLALLDINMPGLSGIDVVQQYKQGQASKPPQFIALSAHATEEMEHACLKAGFKYFIHKPLTLAKITKLLANTFPRSSEIPDSSLLEYLANNSQTTLERLKTRQQHAFQTELEKLKKHHASGDITRQRRSVHKLTGIASIRGIPRVLELLESLSLNLKSDSRSDRIAEQVNELSDLITNQ